MPPSELPLRLFLLPVLLLLLGEAPATAWAMRLAVLAEPGLLQPGLVERTVDRRVNQDPLVFPGLGETDPLTCQLVPAADSLDAVHKLCQSGGFHGLVGVGSCSLGSTVHRLAKSMRVPAIFVPAGELCQLDTAESEFSFVGDDHPSGRLQSIVSLLSSKSASLVSIFFDSHQKEILMRSLHNQLSSAGIAAVSFQIDARGANLSKILTGSIKKKVKFNVILAKPDVVYSLIQQAVVAETIQAHYYWLALDEGLRPIQLLRLLPPNVSANVMLVRSSSHGLLDPQRLRLNSGCPAALRSVLSDCDPGTVSAVELRTIDAVLAMARAVHAVIGAGGGSANSSNGSCNGATRTWPGGIFAADVLAKTTNFNALGSLISYNGTTRHFRSYIEAVSTYHAFYTDPLSYIESARYYPDNASLSVSFMYKEQRLAFPNTFVDFKNRTLRVCAPDFRPYTIFDSNTYGKITGHSEDLINVLRIDLNFSTITVKPSDGVFGTPINGTQQFSGCIGELQKGNSDLAMLFAITNVRYAVVDYLDDYLYSSNNILVRIPPPASKMWNVFTPMTLEVWLLLGGFMFVVPFIIYLLAVFSPFSAWNLKLSFGFADEVWYKEYLWSSIGSFLQQGQDFYPFAMSPRTVLAFWWLLTVIIFGAYTGDLAAHLAISASSVPIQTIDDLVSMPYYTALVPKGTNIQTAIDMATSGPMFKLKAMSVLVQSHEDCARKLLAATNPYTVCIADQMSNLYFAAQYCSSVYVAKEYFNFYYLAWTVPKDAFYADAMNFVLRRARENGLVDMLRLKYFPTSSSECSSSQLMSEADPINLEGIGGSCLVPGVLYVMGLLILLLEYCWVVCLKKDPLQCILF